MADRALHGRFSLRVSGSLSFERNLFKLERIVVEHSLLHVRAFGQRDSFQTNHFCHFLWWRTSKLDIRLVFFLYCHHKFPVCLLLLLLMLLH